MVVIDELAGGSKVPATVSVDLTWRGGGGRRHVTASSPAFDGRVFRTGRARGTFAASEDGFSFASLAARPVRSMFAELGTERNGLFVGALASCARCAGW